MRGCSIKGLCRLSGISSQAYYHGKKERKRQQIEDNLVIDLVLKLRVKHPRMGTRKLLGEIQPGLWEDGISIGRDRLFEILKRHDLLVQPKYRSPKTTYYDNQLPVYRNLLYELEPTAPHQVWVADITYIDTDDGFAYLSLITDRFSRKIVGWNLGQTMEASQSINALAMAINQTPSNRWPIHHSDRGSQYCCREYARELHQRGLPISMTEANHCYENSHAERVNGILKNEYNLDLCFRTLGQARRAVEEAILMYNDYRPHLSLHMSKPAEVHQHAA